MPLLGSFGEYKLIFQLVLLQSKGTYPMYTSLWRTCRAHQLTNVTKTSGKKCARTSNSITPICKVSSSNSIYISRNIKDKILTDIYS